MRKVLVMFLVVMFVASNCYGVDINDWIRGDGTDSVKGTDNASDIDADVTNYLQDPLDKVLTEHITGCAVTYDGAATVKIGIGEVVCYNAAKTIKRMRRNVAANIITITLPANGASGGSLDTGNAAISTWYHVYAVADADATTFTGICSASASAPTGVTYFRYLGSFYNNAADDIDDFKWSGKSKDILVMWDVPVSATTVLSNGAWSAAIPCRMPSTSTCGVFGILAKDSGADGTADTAIKPFSGTWSTSIQNGVRYNGSAGAEATGQRVCMTDSSQQISHRENGAGDTLAIDVEGYYFSR